MSRSRARLAADWFAKLRQNAVTQEVEHPDVVEAKTAADNMVTVVGPAGPTGPTGPAGSADTAAQVLAKIKTVDGSGSGLNADLLDNISEASFMRRSANSQLNMNNNDIIGVDQIFHHGDTNTYIQFHAADQFRVVTGGTERLEVNNTRTQIDNLEVTGNLNGGKPSTSASAVGSVGSYCFALATGGSANGPNVTEAGSGMRYSDSDRYAGTVVGSGTWRSMGHGRYKDRAILWLRIS